MERAEFAGAYEDRQPIYHGEYLPQGIPEVLAPFDEWDTYFGDTLYSLMLDGDAISIDAAREAQKAYALHTIREEASQSLNRVSEIFSSAMETGEIATEQCDMLKRQQLNVLMGQNFHVMSQLMAGHWDEMIWGVTRNSSDKKRYYNSSMFNLAEMNVRYALQRKEKSSIHNNHEFFDQSYEAERAYIHGVMSEIDTAIVLSDISIRNPDFIFVPAPKRFEASRGKKFNVDFIGYRISTDDVIGIQVKTKVNEETRARYDKSRVVLISAEDDLGGVIVTRTKRGSSNIKAVPWPGMVAADFLNSLKLHGEKRLGLEHINPRYLLNLKYEAGKLLRPEYHTTSVKSRSLPVARERVMRKICETLDAEKQENTA